MTKNDKAARILRAALEEFLAAGFKDAKIEEIAKRAGVGKGTVYQYFTSKEQLFEAMIDQGMAHYVEGLAQSLSPSDTLQVNLQRLVQMHYQFIQDHQSIAQLFYAHDIQLTDQIKCTFSKHQQRIVALLGAWLLEMVALGEVPQNTDYRLFLSLLFGTLNQYYAPHLPGNAPVMTPEVFATTMFKLLEALTGLTSQSVN